MKLAQAEVDATLAALPKPLREATGHLPIAFEKSKNNPRYADKEDDDLLGLFVGVDLPSSESSNDPIPAQIILFLDNIWDYADGDGQVYREEVRTTLLHELGHYLGLDEIDLEERGLD